MIVGVQFAKTRLGHHEIVYPWAIFAVPGEDTMSKLFNKIKEGKKDIICFYHHFLMNALQVLFLGCTLMKI